MDLRRRLQRRTLISAAMIFTALFGCLAWWTLHDTRREIDATRALVRATIATVLRAQSDAPAADTPAAGASATDATAAKPPADEVPNPALRHVTIELLTSGQTPSGKPPLHWIDRAIDAQPEAISLPGNSSGPSGRVLLVRPNARSELIEHLMFAGSAFGAIVLLGAVIAWLQYQALIRAFAPVQTLKHQIEKFEHGELSARLPVPELDELAVIANSFNRLANTLQLTINEQARLSQSLISTRTEERHRLARELHDDLGQLLTAMSVNVASLKRSLGDPVRAQATVLGLERDLHGLREATRKMLADLRDDPDQRLLQQHQPDHVIKDWQQKFSAVHWRLPADLSERFGRLRVAEHEVAARVLQEALTNVFKHANPTVIDIDLRFASGSDGGRASQLIIENDGVAEADAHKLERSSHMGITGMQERASKIDALLSAALSPDSPACPRWRVELRFGRA